MMSRTFSGALVLKKVHEHVLRSAQEVAPWPVVSEFESGPPVQTDEEETQELGCEPSPLALFPHELAKLAMGNVLRIKISAWVEPADIHMVR
jgi:hypothetical protein